MMVSILKIYKYEDRYFLDGFQLLEFGKEELIKGKQEQLYEFPLSKILNFVMEFENLFGEQMDVEYNEISEEYLTHVYNSNNKQY